MSRSTQKPNAWARVAHPLVALGLLVLLGCGRPPQMGPDEGVFTAVDALFTAVTARDAALLSRCELRLQGCKDTGTLPAAAGEYLDDVIARARAGQWERAAEKLYTFMEGQRREGATAPHKKAGPRPVRPGRK